MEPKDFPKLPSLVVAKINEMFFKIGNCYLCNKSTSNVGVCIADKSKELRSPYTNENGQTLDRFYLYYLCSGCEAKDSDRSKVEEKILANFIREVE